jgi:hypothetical protein
MTQVGIVQEILPSADTESDSSVETETFNIIFSKQVPLSFRKSEAKEHRSSVHIQPQFDLFQFFPETIPLQATDILNTKPSQLPMERTVLGKVNKVDLLPSDAYAEISEPLMKPISTSIITQTDRELMLTTDVLSNQDTMLVSPQLASGDKTVKGVNPEEIIVESKELQTVGSHFTDPAVSRSGAHMEELEDAVKQILSEVSVQGNLLEATENFRFLSELRNEVHESPTTETHVNIFTMQPHEEAVIELLPRKKTCARNEYQVNPEKGADDIVLESPINRESVHDVVQQPDLNSHIAEPETTDKLNVTKLMSPTLVPFSVKQSDAAQHCNKSEEISDSFQFNNCPDKLSVPLADGTMLPMSIGQTESTHSVDDKWSNILPIISFPHISDNPEEGKYMNLPTYWSTGDIFRSCHAQSNKNDVQKTVPISDFDDDIEVDVFDEDNPRHSLHELEETVSQLVSDVDMDETQLLKHLSCLENAGVNSSKPSDKDVSQNDNLELHKTMSNTANTQYESPQKQGPLEDNRSIRAEIKLLVKTSDTGKEAIEIHSMREYSDMEVAHRQEDTPSMFRADLKASHNMLKNFQEQVNLPHNLESLDRDITVQLKKSSTFKNDESIQLSHEPLQSDPSLNIKICEEITIGNYISNNAECVPSVYDLKQAYTSVPSEHQHQATEAHFLWLHDELLNDFATQEPQTQNKWQQKNILKVLEGNKQQSMSNPDQQDEQYQSVKEESHKYSQEQKIKQQMREIGSNNLEMKIEETEKHAKYPPKTQSIKEGKYIKKIKQPQNGCEMRTVGRYQQKAAHQQSMAEQTQTLQEQKSETAEKTQDKNQLGKPRYKPEQQEGKEENRQLHHIQRLFIRSPDFVLSEPLNMLPPDVSTKQQNSSAVDVSSAIKERSHQIKKLLVRSVDSENCITFPSSLPSDRLPVLISPSPPPQQLPKTRLFENLPQVPLASEENLRPVSPLSQNIPFQNIFFSFLPMDDQSDISDNLSLYTPPTHCLSMPSLTVRASSSTMSLSGKHLSSSLTRVASMPSLQDPMSPIITNLHEPCLSSSHNSDTDPEHWASLLDNKDEPSLIMQGSLNTSQINSPSSVAGSTCCRSDTFPSPWQPYFSPPRSPDSSRRHHSESPFSSFCSYPSEVLIPHKSPALYRHYERTSPDMLDSLSSDCCSNRVITTPPRSPGTHHRPHRTQHRYNQISHVNALTTCSQTPSSDAQAISDPWYLQTEFLLSPSVIPSGYCTWVSTSNQQAHSRGKAGVDFKIFHFVDT